MITIGLVAEISFISKSLKTAVTTTLKSNYTGHPIIIKIDNDILEVEYNSHKIWRESLRQPTSMFGVESASEIARIVFLIDNNNDEWKKHVYIEK